MMASINAAVVMVSHHKSCEEINTQIMLSRSAEHPRSSHFSSIFPEINDPFYIWSYIQFQIKQWL